MDKKKTVISALGPLRVKKNEPMSLHTGNKVGGTAELYYEALTTTELSNVCLLGAHFSLPVTVLGGGTNVLVSDRGILGIVVKNRSNEIKMIGYKGKIEHGKKAVRDVLIAVDSGVQMGHLVRYTIGEALGGLESFLGLPGTIGGAIYNNSHFQRHGRYISDWLVSATLWSTEEGIKEIKQDYFKFAYDYSILQETKEIVLKAVFKLQPGRKEELWEKAEEASRLIRISEQPYNVPSCGCTWKNIRKEDAMRLATPNLTVSAGYLIDKIGLKGFRIGDAQISDKHANFIVNVGCATSEDWLAVMQETRKRVRLQFGVRLYPEIFLLGNFTEEERGQVLN